MCKEFTYLSEDVSPESGLSGDIITLDYADIRKVARIAYHYTYRAVSDQFGRIANNPARIPHSIDLEQLEQSVVDLRKAARLFEIVSAPDRFNLRIFSDNFESITHLCHKDKES